MDERRIDLSALDPARDSEGWERLVGAIVSSALPELDRRAAGANLLVVVGGWARPALAAAAILTLLLAGTLVRGRVVGDAGAPALVEALDVPHPVAAWLEEERPPSVPDLILAVEGGTIAP